MSNYQSLENLTNKYLTILKESNAKEAVAIIIINGQKVLGVSRGKGTDSWGLPGGKVESGETKQQAIIRETKEETGIDIDPSDISFFYKTSEGTFITSIFLYKGKTPENFISSNEGDVDWISWEKLFQGPFGVTCRQLFLELANGRR